MMNKLQITILAHWHIFISILYLVSVLLGLLYWSNYYDYLGVSFYDYFTLEDLVTSFLRKPMESFIILMAFVFSYLMLFIFSYILESLINEKSLLNKVLKYKITFLILFHMVWIPMTITNQAQVDATKVLLFNSNYYNITLSNKTDTMKSVVLAGVLSEYIVIYNMKTLKTTVISKSKVSTIEPTNKLKINSSIINNLIHKIPPYNTYDKQKLQYRGYKICHHVYGGVLPCKKDGTFLKEE